MAKYKLWCCEKTERTPAADGEGRELGLFSYKDARMFIRQFPEHWEAEDGQVLIGRERLGQRDFIRYEAHPVSVGG